MQGLSGILRLEVKNNRSIKNYWVYDYPSRKSILQFFHSLLLKNTSLYFVCVSVWWSCVYVCWSCVYMWKPEITINCLPQSPSTSCPSAQNSFIWLNWLVSEPQRPICHWVTGVCHSMRLAGFVCAGYQIRVLLHSQQGPSQLRELHDSWQMFVMQHSTATQLPSTCVNVICHECCNSSNFALEISAWL